jgi:hypothetical protein
MIDFLYYIESVSLVNALLIAYTRPSKMLRPRILKTSFKMSLEPKAFPLNKWFKIF